MKCAFIITSAINTKFGVYNTATRLQQTLDTVASIRSKVPDATIFAVEMAGILPTAEQTATMNQAVDRYIVYSNDNDVQGIYNSTDNWDIVKNTTEVMCFSRALDELSGELKKFDRVFKISGRYILSDSFDINTFADTTKIIVAQRKTSQFGSAITGGISQQYMSRLWSWPGLLTDQIIELYNDGFLYMAQQLTNGGYCDIEHMLFAFLPADLVQEVNRVGIRGLLGPNGVAVED